jgi:uncharacterized membrane protein YagU involved in acid resistance
MSWQSGRYLIGAAAGLMATAPMTGWMTVAKRYLSWRSQEPLPPTQITHNALQAVDMDDDLSQVEEGVLTAVNHFGYGAAAGALYGRLHSPGSASRAVTLGAVYGLGVWSCSYFGLMPATGLYRSPVDDTAERNALMIVAHIVWGGSLGLATHALVQSSVAGRKIGFRSK